MRRLQPIILLIGLLVLNLPAAVVYAEPPCEPAQPCPRLFHISPVVAIASKVPFAWLRSAPNSSSPVVYTVTVPGKFYLHPEKALQPSQGEMWIEVSLVPNARIHGWVEYKSLTEQPEIASPGSSMHPSDPEQFKANERLLGSKWVSPPKAASARLAPRTKSAWVRKLPGSPEILAILTPASSFQVLNMLGAHFDGTQWWWPVQADTPQGPVNGWLEQSSIVVVYTSKPSPTAILCKPGLGCETL